MVRMENGYYWAFHKDGASEIVEVSGNGASIFMVGSEKMVGPVSGYDELFIDYLVGPVKPPFVMHRDEDLFGVPDKSFMKMYRMSDIRHEAIMGARITKEADNG